MFHGTKISSVLWFCFFFTVHDYHGYGIFYGLCTKGYLGCLMCGPRIISRHSKPSRKLVYGDMACQMLDMNHPF